METYLSAAGILIYFFISYIPQISNLYVSN